MIINKYIVHVLDKNSDVPILNDFENKINPEMDKFLQKSIRKVIRHDLLRKAKFKNYSNNYIRVTTENILYNEKSFLENSKELASKLFDIVKTNADINSCDLVISLITIKDEKYIALLKFDYKSLYNHHISFKEDKLNIKIVENENVISSTSTIKQAAIFGVSGINDEYDLRVLDVESERERIRSSFKEDFLEIHTIEDDTYKTREFERVSSNFITNAFSDNIKKAEDARSVRDYMLKENSVLDIDKFIEVALDKELKESFIEYLEDNGVDSDFNIDKKFIEKKLRNRKIKTDNGFEVKANREDFEDPMKYSVKQNPDGSIDITIKNIRHIKDK